MLWHVFEKKRAELILILFKDLYLCLGPWVGTLRLCGFILYKYTFCSLLLLKERYIELQPPSGKNGIHYYDISLENLQMSFS
jgi:hypothetical protein